MDITSQSTIELRTGNEMPIIGLGTWQLSHDTAGAIASALSMGYPMIDTSGDYGTQPGIGEGIKKSGARREDFYLVTKIEEDDDAYEAAKANLHELGLDYADLMLIHRPPRRGNGEALWDGLIRAKREGLTKDIGVSNYTIEQIRALSDASGEVPVTNQIEWSPFGHSSDMLQFCEDNDIVIQAYSPLTRRERLNDETLETIAEAHGKTPAQVLIRWNLQLGVVPIIKANSAEHQRENLDVFDFELSDEEMHRLSSLNELFSSLGPKPQYV